LDCRNELLLSDFNDPSLFSLLLPKLLIRKKFFSFCGNGLWPLGCLFDDIGMPEKVRFSFVTEIGLELWKRVVIKVDCSLHECCSSAGSREENGWICIKGEVDVVGLDRAWSCLLLINPAFAGVAQSNFEASSSL
jgi:hypothetical protein